MKRIYLILLGVCGFCDMAASSRAITLKNRWISTITIDDPQEATTRLLPAQKSTRLTFDETSRIELRRHILGTYSDYTSDGLNPTTVLSKSILDNLFPNAHTVIIDENLTLKTPRQIKTPRPRQGKVVKIKKMISNRKDTAFLIIDIQADFVQLPVQNSKTGKIISEQGSLAVADTGQNYIDTCEEFVNSVKLPHFFTKDYHPKGHISFASRWKKPPFTSLAIENIPGITNRVQMLWPDHCVQGSEGAKILLTVAPDDVVVQKGTDINNDSYSGFKDDGGQETELKSLLKKQKIKTVIVIGIATDYCVRASVLHALEAGFKVIVITNLCRGVRLPGDESIIPADSLAAFKDMQSHGASLYFLDYLADGTSHQQFLKALKDYGLSITEITEESMVS